eukprot:3678605-Amphidinium_carterae.2
MCNTELSLVGLTLDQLGTLRDTLGTLPGHSTQSFLCSDFKRLISSSIIPFQDDDMICPGKKPTTNQATLRYF